MTLDHALRYASRGWRVFPVKERDKVPATIHGLLDATTDEAAVRSWWVRDWNIGIVTGAVSGLVVLDVDAGHGGMESLPEMSLPDTATVLTGGGGLHYYFAHPGYPVRNATGVLPGIDIRGDGGYVVAPPSIHTSGRRYEWEVIYGEESPLAPWPLIQTRAAERPPAPEGASIANGQRNSELASLAGSMRRRGMTSDEIFVALQSVNARCEPPLGERELRLIATSISRYAPQARPPRRVPGGFRV